MTILMIIITIVHILIICVSIIIIIITIIIIIIINPSYGSFPFKTQWTMVSQVVLCLLLFARVSVYSLSPIETDVEITQGYI